MCIEKFFSIARVENANYQENNEVFTYTYTCRRTYVCIYIYMCVYECL